MLRFLNLNSPISSPAQAFSSFSSTTNNTPDLSPVSATSALMTPSDLSPATGFDKLNFDFTQSMPPSQSLLFETSPSRFHPSAHSPAQKSFYAEHSGVRGYSAINLPYVDPFSSLTSSMYLHQNLSRGTDLARSTTSSWNGPHIANGGDWLRVDDKTPEETPLVAGARALNVPSFHVVQPVAHTHEVGVCTLRWHLPVF